MTVINPDGSNGTKSNAFTYLALVPPVISSITPSEGPESGGIQIEIYGSGFVTTGTTQVLFGEITATDVQVLSPGYGSLYITCILPAHAPGFVDVTVINPDGSSATKTEAFTYLEEYTVTFNLDGKGTRTGGGELVQTVVHGEAAIEPIVTANTGWVFEGWDVPFETITAPLTVTAQYSVATYAVTFNLDGKGTRTGGGELIQTVAHGEAAIEPIVTANTAFDLNGKGTRTGGGELVQTVAHGEAAIEPIVTANTGWVFEGWDMPFNDITSPMTVTAQYSVATYTVTFDLNGKGTRTGGGELVQTVAHGEAAIEPIVTANAGWIFEGWDTPFNDIIGPLSITAQYSVATYTVTFDLDGKGTRTGGGELVQFVSHGEAALEPIVIADPGWIYEGWDTPFTNITEPLTVTAQYSVATYTVTFDLDGKGTRIGGGELIQTVAHGTAALAPEVEANAGWEFVGWSAPFDNITGPLTVTARYNAEIYTVTFDLNGKGTRIGGGKLEQMVFYGGSAIEPVVEANPGWVFEGWDVPFDLITGPLTVTAQYSVATYTVTFELAGKGTRTGGGELIQIVTHGEAALAPEVEGNAGWIFEGWDAPFDIITGPLTVTAQYAVATYTVTFDLSGNGIRTGGGELVQTVAHGEAALEPIVTANTGWIFNGWDVPFDSVTGPLTVTAQYSVATYYVTFVLLGRGTRTGGGELNQVVAHGESAIAPIVSALPGWIFEGWDVSFDTITGPLTVTAQYTMMTYTVTFDLAGKGIRTGGGELVQTVPHSGSAMEPIVLPYAGWIFEGWDVPFDTVTAPLTVTAQYSRLTYTVTFDLDGKGTHTGGGELMQTVAYGEAAIAPIVTANTGWVFEGWDLPFDTVTGPLTVTAQYSVATYMVTFNLDGKGTRIGGGNLVQMIAYGNSASTPMVAANAGWVFEGWDLPFTNITAPLTVTAQYSRLTYTVTFDLDGKGTRIGGGELVQIVAYGEAAIPPVIIPNDGWVFEDWDPPFDTVTGPLTVTARYHAAYHTVTFDLDGKGTRTGGGTLVQTVAHGQSALAPEVEGTAGWVFTGWNVAFDIITSPLTVTAQYVTSVTPVISSITPSTGLISGGIEVRIMGSGFTTTGTTQILFGETAATNVEVMYSGYGFLYITCVLPEHTPGTVDVTVINPGGGSNTKPQAFTYLESAPPAIMFITPTGGPATGGIEVSIYGSRFVTTGTTQVLFDDTPATNVTVNNQGYGLLYITCILPAHAPGIVDVTVINPDGGRDTKPALFTYREDDGPVVSSVEPSEGPASGGIEISIHGSYFETTETPQVLFGETSAVNIEVYDLGTGIQRIMCLLPAHAPGVVDVTVTNPNGNSGTKEAAFTYFDSPDEGEGEGECEGEPLEILSVNPDYGPTTGGIQVDISGTGFQPTGTTQVFFGNSEATEVHVQSDGGWCSFYVTCILPINNPGKVAVTVINPDFSHKTKLSAFTYVNPEGEGEGEGEGELHPADLNGDWRIKINEAIAYLAGWQQGGNPIAYAIRAAYLWQNGESYTYDMNEDPPMCWILVP